MHILLYYVIIALFYYYNDFITWRMRIGVRVGFNRAGQIDDVTPLTGGRTEQSVSQSVSRSDRLVTDRVCVFRLTVSCGWSYTQQDDARRDEVRTTLLTSHLSRRIRRVASVVFSANYELRAVSDSRGCSLWFVYFILFFNYYCLEIVLLSVCLCVCVKTNVISPLDGERRPRVNVNPKGGHLHLCVCLVR